MASSDGIWFCLFEGDALNFRARLHRESENATAALADAVRAEELATACKKLLGHRGNLPH